MQQPQASTPSANTPAKSPAAKMPIQQQSSLPAPMNSALWTQLLQHQLISNPTAVQQLLPRLMLPITPPPQGASNSSQSSNSVNSSNAVAGASSSASTSGSNTNNNNNSSSSSNSNTSSGNNSVAPKPHETASVALASSSSSSASSSSSSSSSSFSNNPAPSRKWQLSFPKQASTGSEVDQQQQADSSSKQSCKLEGSDLNIQISMKIRGEEPKNFVPDKLYSSHKYVIQHTITGSLVSREYPLLVSKIFVVDPSKPEEEILKNGKVIIKGSSEAAITRTNDNGHMLQGSMKVQFTDVSYHHEKKYFAFKMCYFDPSKLDTPLFILVSPSFRTYARKPTVSESGSGSNAGNNGNNSPVENDDQQQQQQQQQAQPQTNVTPRKSKKKNTNATTPSSSSKKSGTKRPAQQQQQQQQAETTTPSPLPLPLLTVSNGMQQLPQHTSILELHVSSFTTTPSSSSLQPLQPQQEDNNKTNISTTTATTANNASPSVMTNQTSAATVPADEPMADQSNNNSTVINNVNNNNSITSSSNEEDNSGAAPAAKRLKQAVLDQIAKKLEELAALKEQLSEDDKRVASEWSVEKLLSVDPEYTMNLLLNPEAANVNNTVANSTSVNNTTGSTQQAQQQDMFTE